MRLDFRGHFEKCPPNFLLYGSVVKWLKTPVCKTACLNWREFESHRCLHGGWRNGSRNGTLN